MLDRHLRGAAASLAAGRAKSGEAFDDLVVVEALVGEDATDDRAGPADATPAVDVDRAPREALLDRPDDLVVPVVVDHIEVGDGERHVAQVEPAGFGDLSEDRLVGLESVGRRR